MVQRASLSQDPVYSRKRRAFRFASKGQPQGVWIKYLHSQMSTLSYLFQDERSYTVSLPLPWLIQMPGQIVCTQKSTQTSAHGQKKCPLNYWFTDIPEVIHSCNTLSGVQEKIQLGFFILCYVTQGMRKETEEILLFYQLCSLFQLYYNSIGTA